MLIVITSNAIPRSSISDQLAAMASSRTLPVRHSKVIQRPGIRRVESLFFLLRTATTTHRARTSLEMVFTAPKIVEGEFGWGPPNEVDKVKALTYAPFTKSDKFGRAADWNQSGYSKYGGCEFPPS